MADTFDLQALGVSQGGTTVQGNTRKPSPRMVEVYFNIEDSAINSGGGVAATDILQVIDVPANTLVLAAGIEILIAGTSDGAATLDLDSGKSANLYVAAGDPLTAAHMAEANGGSQSRLYIAADTIDITVNTATWDTGRARVWALMVDVSSKIGNTVTWTA